jgi:hypothetical protein
MGSITADTSSINGADTLSVQASSSFTDPGGIVQSDSGNQSIHTTVTHGTQGTVQTAPNSGNNNNKNSHHMTASNPSSPLRGNDVPATSGTPLNTSPASTAGRSQVHPDVLGTVEFMPQYSHLQHHHHPPPAPPPQQQQQHQQRPQLHLPQQQQQQQHPLSQHGDVFLVHHQQQQQQQRNYQQQQQQQQQQPIGLHQTYPTHRERSNPVSELETDDLTEPSTSANTGGETGYTRSDNAVLAATSTFGRLIQSATRVSNL